jgi:DNA-binding NtrC family response regulator
VAVRHKSLAAERVLCADIGVLRPNVRKVLLVDDDPVQLRIREAVLRGAGLEVHGSASAAAAIDMLRNDVERSIGIVLTDHIMPDVTGAEFVRELRRIVPEMPVVVVSGLPEAESEYEGLDVTFRQKPCPPPELISVVKRSLNSAA